MNKKEVIKKYLNRYFLTALNGMAIGLFASLIIGTMLSTIIQIPFLQFLSPITDVLSSKELVYGAAIGCGVALALKHKPIVVVSSLVCGSVALNQGGGPLGAYLASLVACEVGGLICGKTKVDIIITPLVTILTGGVVAILTSGLIGEVMNLIGVVINSATDQNPIIMGIVIAVIVGITLTLPISSAAICISLELSGLAAGAAVVGCSVQMIGFAVQSIKKDGVSGFISVGIGTSMLQFTNIVRKPTIWLPTIITSAILGPISTTVFKLTNTSVGAGMGTCGLVGQINAFKDNGFTLISTIQIVSLHIILPITLVYILNKIFIKINLYNDDDLKLYRETKEEENNEK
ncbi:MAG: PTS sugar transporter subunit IIC [bacterium]